MPNIGEIVDRLFPVGTNPPTGGEKKQDCPLWPPDLFAVTAALAETSDCYAGPQFTAGWDPDRFFFTDEHRDNVRSLAAAWAKGGIPPQAVKDLWQKLMACSAVEICRTDQTARWASIAITLLTIADDASVGFGFPPVGNKTDLAYAVYKGHLSLLDAQVKGLPKPANLRFPYLPHSLCIMVPETEVCVQPKTNTPKVGCALRSLSHHLALLPAKSVVATEWVFAQPGNLVLPSENPLNILLVPFPYVVRGIDFLPSTDAGDRDNRYFALGQTWLQSEEGPADAEAVVQFLSSLVEASQREVDTVHAVVLPESALPKQQVADIADRLVNKLPRLELFITGTCTAADAPEPRNEAYTCRFHDGKRLKEWFQSKHHRWCIERTQIERYHLGHALDPDRRWWERIQIDDRRCVFSVVRPGASLAVLVCEDLARYDPVLPVINAVGPNLVIALLMDGPQMERRWPGRYATSLADDPGCSVLTLSCLGMVNKSKMPGEPAHRSIALWKEPGGMAKELKLDRGEHGMLLSLTSSPDEQFTLDRRSDGRGSRILRLNGARGTKLPKVVPWPELD